MIDSRNIDDLHPAVAAKARALIARCADAGIRLIVTSTWRDHAAQAALYAQGRTRPGKIVTYAKPGQSWHNWRVAFDVVPLQGEGRQGRGRPVWGTTGANGVLWHRVGETGEALGLEWGGRWKMRDMPHFQYTGGLTLADFAAGRTLPSTLA